MNRDELQALFSQPPASFQWAQGADGDRTIGTSAGAALDLWPDRVEFAGLFPPDSPELAARNATLMQLLLTALRRDWISASDWLTAQMRMAARSKEFYEGPNYSRRVSFAFDRKTSRATLKVKVKL